MLTMDEKVALERIGIAISVRRRLQGLTTHEAAHIAEMSETSWREMEHGAEALKVRTLAKMFKTLDIDTGMLAGVIEHLALSEYHKDDIKKIKLEPEKVGRPRRQESVETKT
jgi:hypothetical protein